MTVRRQPEGLWRHRDSVRSDIEHDDVDYPSALPTEILSLIFEAVQAVCLSDEYNLVPAELLLSLVSRHWRYVALGTPALWTTIHVSTTSPLGLKNLNTITQYLGRSKACPLNVRLDFTDLRISPKMICDAIFPHAGRWQRLDISSDRPYVIRTIINRLRDMSAPHLHDLSIVLNDELVVIEDFDDVCTQILIGGAQNLSVVRLECIGLSNAWPPLSTVTTLHLHTLKDIRGVRYNHIRQMLMGLTSLINLSIDAEVVDMWPFDSPGTIELPSLRSLRVRGLDNHCLISDLLLTISAVRLESMWLENVVNHDFHRFRSPDIASTALDFPCLQFLTFKNVDLDVQIYTIFAHYLPAIVHLSLIYPLSSEFNPPGIWNFLCDHYAGMKNPPWPQLQAISIRGAPPKETAWFHIVHTRIAIGYPLDRLCLDGDAMSSLKQVDGGLHRPPSKWLQEVVEVEELAPLRLPVFPEADVDYF